MEWGRRQSLGSSLLHNMADDCEAREQRTLETIKLSCLPSYPGGLSWSLDDRISVITDQCVYILVSFYILTRYKT